jgi:hypothetical protein
MELDVIHLPNDNEYPSAESISFNFSKFNNNRRNVSPVHYWPTSAGPSITVDVANECA